MPGPGQRNKAKDKAKLKSKQAQTSHISRNLEQNQTEDASAPKASVQCQTLEEDEMTYCDQPTMDRSERCNVHQAQYRIMYLKYKEAAKHVDEVKQGGSLPVKEQIARYADIRVVLKKVEFVRKYVEAIRVERTGRDLHGRRFFCKKEMIKALEAVKSLEVRAYDLYVNKNPIPEWAKPPPSDPGLRKPQMSAEEIFQSAQEPQLDGMVSAGKPRLTISKVNTAIGGEEDLIDMDTRSRKTMIADALLFMLGLDTPDLNAAQKEESRPKKSSQSYITKIAQTVYQQYIRRVVFYEPNLFLKAIDKVSFEDLFLSDAFSFEDAVVLLGMFHPDALLGFNLMWFKDAVLETLFMARSEFLNNPANVGNPKDRFKILGGWMFNVPHVRNMPNEGWYILLKLLSPPANVENRFVRLCNNFDDLISFLTFGAFGCVPHPFTCGEAWPYRNHLSLSGVIIADMITASRPPHMRGPMPSTRKPRIPGNVIWAEMESRASLFGAIRLEPSAFNDAFLENLRSRPDLFQVLTRSETDPGRKVEMFGDGPSNALPKIRSRMFELPPNASGCAPSDKEWTIEYSAEDVLYSTKKQITGYLTKLERGGAEASGFFFRFKKFPVKYIVIIDAVPYRDYEILARNVAWAALRAHGYGTGDYNERRYAIASDTFYGKHVEERLSFLPPRERVFSKMADNL